MVAYPVLLPKENDQERDTSDIFAWWIWGFFWALYEYFTNLFFRFRIRESLSYLLGYSYHMIFVYIFLDSPLILCFSFVRFRSQEEYPFMIVPDFMYSLEEIHFLNQWEHLQIMKIVSKAFAWLENSLFLEEIVHSTRCSSCLIIEYR